MRFANRLWGYSGSGRQHPLFVSNVSEPGLPRAVRQASCRRNPWNWIKWPIVVLWSEPEPLKKALESREANQDNACWPRLKLTLKLKTVIILFFVPPLFLFLIFFVLHSVWKKKISCKHSHDSLPECPKFTVRGLYCTYMPLAWELSYNNAAILFHCKTRAQFYPGVMSLFTTISASSMCRAAELLLYVIPQSSWWHFSVLCRAQ